jgi:DNA modification methylase
MIVMAEENYRNKILNRSAMESWPLPDCSVGAIITSPPYWQHRDNGFETNTILGGDKNCTHLWKENKCSCGAEKIQIGQEPNPTDYIRHLVTIFDGEGKRVLRPYGQLWVNIGETFSSGLRDISWGAPKQQLLIPFRFAIAMQERGWVLRNTLIWAKGVTFEDGISKGGGMPSAVHDRLNLNYEPFFGFVKEPKLRESYYFNEESFEISKEKIGSKIDYFSNMDAIRIKPIWVNDIGERIDFYGRVAGSRPNAGASPKQHSLGQPNQQIHNHPFGKNPGSVWQINIDPFEGQKISHTAPYPIALIKQIIKFSTPEWVCKKCNLPISTAYNRKTNYLEMLSCKCNDGKTKPLVFDPFMGSGTTALAALELDRDFCGLELNTAYFEECEKRIKEKLKKVIKKLIEFN